MATTPTEITEWSPRWEAGDEAREAESTSAEIHVPLLPVDAVRHALQQELLPELRLTQNLCRTLSQQYDGLRRELVDQLTSVVVAIQRAPQSHPFPQNKRKLTGSTRVSSTQMPSTTDNSENIGETTDAVQDLTDPTHDLEETSRDQGELPGALESDERDEEYPRVLKQKSKMFCLDEHVDQLSHADKALDKQLSFSGVVVGDGNDVGRISILRRSSIWRARKCVWQIVEDTRFDGFYGVLIILNALSMGVQTDIIARSSSEITPLPLQILDMFFCVAFLVELIMRLLAYGPEFFYLPGWMWSWFDLTLVAMQLFEEGVALIARLNSDDGGQGGGNYSFLRVLRVFRLVRLVRLARILRFVRQLRTLVHSIGESVQSLGWTMLLLVMLIYTVAIYFTQAVSNHRHSIPRDMLQTSANNRLEYYFGNLGRSILSLFEATFGGVDWDSLADPIMSELSPLLCLIFAFYIAFVVLAMLNVVTGVFVEHALQGSAADKESQVVTQLKEIFEEFDADKSGTISHDEFEYMLANPANQQYLKSFDINMSQARNLFYLMDVEGRGCVDTSAFIIGCLRLRGTARAADITTLMYELQRSNINWRMHAERVEIKLDKLARHHSTMDVIGSPSSFRRSTQKHPSVSTNVRDGADDD